MIQAEGAIKISSLIQSTILPPHILELTQEYTKICAVFRSLGTET